MTRPREVFALAAVVLLSAAPVRATGKFSKGRALETRGGFGVPRTPGVRRVEGVEKAAPPSTENLVVSSRVRHWLRFLDDEGAEDDWRRLLPKLSNGGNATELGSGVEAARKDVIANGNGMLSGYEFGLGLGLLLSENATEKAFAALKTWYPKADVTAAAGSREAFGTDVYGALSEWYKAQVSRAAGASGTEPAQPVEAGRRFVYPAMQTLLERVRSEDTKGAAGMRPPSMEDILGRVSVSVDEAAALAYKLAFGVDATQGKMQERELPTIADLRGAMLNYTIGLGVASGISAGLNTSLSSVPVPEAAAESVASLFSDLGLSAFVKEATHGDQGSVLTTDIAEPRNNRIPFLKTLRTPPAEAAAAAAAVRVQTVIPSMEPGRNTIMDETLDFFHSSEIVGYALGLTFGAGMSAATGSAIPLLLYTGAETLFAASCVVLAKYVLGKPLDPTELDPTLAAERWEAAARKTGAMGHGHGHEEEGGLPGAEAQAVRAAVPGIDLRGFLAGLSKSNSGARQRAWDDAWTRSLQESPDVRTFITGWFYDCDFDAISLDDITEFLCWGVYGREAKFLDEDKMRNIHTAVRALEKSVRRKFPARAAGAELLPCIRFSIEPIRWRHKPLLFYAATQGLVQAYMRKTLTDGGFKRRVQETRDDTGAGKERFRYWYKPGKGVPLVFMHGVGGLPAYSELVIAMSERLGCPVIAIEQPHVSLHVNPSVPKAADVVLGIAEMLEERRLGPAVFVGHSFGSLTLSWMSQALPDLVAGNVFLDPITFQLNLPDVCRSFHYRKRVRKNPLSADSLSDMVSSELFAAHACLRGFWWASSALWAQDLQRLRIPTQVILSTDDSIVPSAAVTEHIQRHKQTYGDRSYVDVANIENCGHGEWIFDKEVKREVVLGEVEAMWKAAAKRAAPTAARFPSGPQFPDPGLSKRVRGALQDLFNNVKATEAPAA